MLDLDVVEAPRHAIAERMAVHVQRPPVDIHLIVVRGLPQGVARHDEIVGPEAVFDLVLGGNRVERAVAVRPLALEITRLLRLLPCSLRHDGHLQLPAVLDEDRPVRRTERPVRRHLEDTLGTDAQVARPPRQRHVARDNAHAVDDERRDGREVRKREAPRRQRRLERSSRIRRIERQHPVLDGVRRTHRTRQQRRAHGPTYRTTHSASDHGLSCFRCFQILFRVCRNNNIIPPPHCDCQL